jgi:hypothetical protein
VASCWWCMGVLVCRTRRLGGEEAYRTAYGARPPLAGTLAIAYQALLVAARAPVSTPPASCHLKTLLTRRLQRYVPGQGGDPPQPGAHPRVGFEVEATLLGNGRVNVEGDVGHGGAISDEELTTLA